MTPQDFFTEDETYYEVVDVIREVVAEVLDSDEVKRMIYQKFREKQLNAVLPDVDFSESFEDDMLNIVDNYLYMGSVINGREYRHLTKEQKEKLKKLSSFFTV